MTPCVEHFIRYFSVEQLYFPFTLLLSKENNKLVIGIHKSKKNGFLVKEWKLFKTKKEDSLPILNKFYIKNLDDLIKDEKIIISEYRLLDFKEIQHRKESQEATGYYARLQENKYKKDIENFLYPDIQKMHRTNWLWKEFCRIHDIMEHNNDITFFNMKLKYEKPEIWNKWLAWKKHLLQAKNVAPELLYYKAYSVDKYSVSTKIETPIQKNNWIQFAFDFQKAAIANNQTGTVTYTIVTQ